MRKVGFFLIIIGIFLLVLVLFNFIKEKNKIISPIPEDSGVKVIFVTPSK